MRADFIKNPNEDVCKLAKGALDYLSQRTSFWAQQRPLYSRDKAEQRTLVRAIQARNLRAIQERAQGYERRVAEQQAQQARLQGRRGPASPQLGGGAPGDGGAPGSPRMPGSPGSATAGDEAARAHAVQQAERVVEMTFRQIDRALERGDLDSAIRVARSALNRSGFQLKPHPQRIKVLSDLHNCLGDIFLKLKSGGEAIAHYRQGGLSHSYILVCDPPSF
jgi:hypothetical protein